MSEFNLESFEEEAHERWLHAFESDPVSKEKFYLNVAYPYPSGAMHVGHGRTYIVPDVIARFWRMKGRQVLYPMAFHVTGAPVIGISKRIANKDEKTIRLYRDLYRVPQNVLDGFVDPLTIVNKLGIGIDIKPRSEFDRQQTQKPAAEEEINLGGGIKIQTDKKQLTILAPSESGRIVDVFAGKEYLFTATVNEQGEIHLAKNSSIAQEMIRRSANSENIRLRPV